MKTNTHRASQGHEETPDSSQAFTRTELLVVIVTVALLSGLLLTAVGRSDDNGTRMVCMNNLRQLGIAFRMYTGDNNDRMAWPNWDGGSGEANPAGWLYKPHVIGSIGCAPAGIKDPLDKTNNPGDTAWQEGLWYPYVKSPKAYLCPVDIESPGYTIGSAGGRNNKLSSYTMNGAVAGFPMPYSTYGYRTMNVAEVWNPACYLLWEPDENVNGPFAFNDGANSPGSYEGPGCLHTINGSHILTVAGDVPFVTAQQLQSEWSKPVPNLGRWSLSF